MTNYRILENAIDANATKIQLIVKDAGKSLIQVIDNGFGMNEIDAEKCFKKHATSKIKSADDLRNITEEVLNSNQKTVLLAIYNNQNQRRYIGVKLDW